MCSAWYYATQVGIYSEGKSSEVPCRMRSFTVKETVYYTHDDTFGLN